ncbi:MAG: BlaI/MecI/CopY family transcriptional regulator [Acidobacteriota bacterium]
MAELPKLSRRESEVMDIVHALGEATAAQVQERMDKPPSNGAIRSTLRILAKKGHLEIEERGPRYVYSAAQPKGAVQQSAARHLLQTFFGGSVQGAVAALLSLEDTRLTADEQDRLKAMIDDAAKEGR